MSLNEDIATVSEDGTVTAIKKVLLLLKQLLNPETLVLKQL